MKKSQPPKNEQEQIQISWVVEIVYRIRNEQFTQMIRH